MEQKMVKSKQNERECSSWRRNREDLIINHRAVIVREDLVNFREVMISLICYSSCMEVEAHAREH